MEFSMPEVPEIPQRDVLKEGRDALTLMKEAYPEIYGLRNQWDRKFATLEAQVGEARSSAETAAVGRQGKKIRAALLKANPGLAKANNVLMRELDQTGPSAIESELTRQTLGDLKLGGALNAEEIRNSQQGTRAAWSARGRSGDNVAMVDEVLNRTTLSDQRKSQRQASASAVDAQNQQRKSGDRAFAQNVFNTQGAYFDPYQRIYGAGGGGSAVTGQVNGPQAFMPFLNSSNSVGASNQQANIAGAQMQMSSQLAMMEMAAQRENANLNRISSENIARGNNRAAMTGGLYAGAGTALGIIAGLMI